MSSLSEEIKSLQEQLRNPSSQADQMYSQLTMELGKSRTSLETQVVELKANIKSHQGQTQTYSIVANNDGILHYISPLSQGMSVQQNQVIAEVSLQQEEHFVIEAYVNATDIAKIQVNDRVNVAIAGINSSKYGTITGHLISIDSGTLSQETSNGNTLLYKVTVSIESTELTSKQDTVKLIKSMPIEARIVYEEETYLEWILNLLNFRN